MSSPATHKAERAKLLIQFGENIRALRKANGRSQQELADNAGLHRTEIGDIECGKTEPRLLTMMILANALNLTLNQLVAGLPVPTERGPSPQERRRAKQLDSTNAAADVKAKR